MISPFRLNGGHKYKQTIALKCNYNVFLENVVLVFILFWNKRTLLMGPALFTHLSSLVFSSQLTFVFQKV